MLRDLFKKLSTSSQGNNPEDATSIQTAEEQRALKQKVLESALCRQITPVGTLYW
jgi:hypothetical protein